MANGVTTQWEDMQVKFGNFEAREKQETLAENYQKNEDKLLSLQPDQKDQDADEFEDEFDKQFFEQYKQQRLMEIQEKALKNKFGKVYEITREEYVDHVTNASQENFVVLHLYQDYIQESVLLNRILDELAQSYPMVKFVKIVATVSFRCAEKFPDSQVPCLIIYRNGKLVSNLPMVHKMLRKISFAAVEFLLAEQSVIQREKDEWDEEKEEIRALLKKQREQKTEFDDPTDDREYSTNQKVYKKY